MPRFLYSERFHLSAEPGRAIGHIWREQTIRPLALIDTWFARHPHWRWLERLSKDWGNPWCAAYCFSWSNFLHNRAQRTMLWNIPYEKVDERIRLAAEAEHRQTYEDPEVPEGCPFDECVVHGASLTQAA